MDHARAGEDVRDAEETELEKKSARELLALMFRRVGEAFRRAS